MDDTSKQKLKNYVLWLLARQEYSHKELIKKLRAKEAPESYIEELLVWCERLGYIDEARYCDSFLRRQINKGFGQKRVLAEAMNKGVDRAQLLQLIETLEVDWFQLAQDAYVKKYAVTAPNLDYKDKAKRVRYMMYRGFSYEEIDFAMQAATMGE
ncbi:regulatory protein RecX [Pseudoalteromonas sp. MMG013]|uniref:Regulatory protein RecX n=1 Tax=Pseudoalteromonas aurantia 208 TaxID=1314867 RepID=A0ABR9EEU0_9GAMM|nr:MULTISPECIES: regulatory protein RecX [Pseudoalteromonas]MBE0369494.1 regulatory protein [Pseudoalteromonas aurantia 208]MBQ4844032.1 regulatory protein RecX [Pseudoalteromonas sp. MMG005]MBQ4861113.1 regulatory protein RecX [Pseudoalteromonas sp. MMG013]